MKTRQKPDFFAEILNGIDELFPVPSVDSVIYHFELFAPVQTKQTTPSRACPLNSECILTPTLSRSDIVYVAGMAVERPY